jgi:hypothetical protein
MFAFSQIIASGGNPLQVAAQMEKDNIANTPKASTNALDDDSSVAVFAAYMATGEGMEQADPAKIAAAKKKAEDGKKAAAELAELQNNDATSAFAGLIEAQSIESKAEKYEGSAPEEKDDDDEKPKVAPKKKASPAKKAKKKISIKPKVKKTDSEAVATDETMDASTLKAIETSSKLPSTPEAASAADKPKIVIKPKVKPVSKVAHKAKKEVEKPKKPEHKIAHKTKKSDDLPPEVKVKEDSLQVTTFQAPEPKVEKEEGEAPASDSNAEVSEKLQVPDLPVDASQDA